MLRKIRSDNLARHGRKVLAGTDCELAVERLTSLMESLCELFSGVGAYISRVEEGSVAERAGLRPGDTILEVNGTPFRAVTHEEALKVSRNFSHLLLPSLDLLNIVCDIFYPDGFISTYCL